jgi:Glyoxalase-like domain
MAKLREIVFDCARAPELARFWAAVLEGYAVRVYGPAEIARLAALGRTPETDPTVLVDGPGPTLCFQEMPGRKTARSRVHLDVAAPDRRREVARLTALGASVVRETERYTVMQDPEGNEFCVVTR